MSTGEGRAVLGLEELLGRARRYADRSAREVYWHARRGWASFNRRLPDVGGYHLHITCEGAGGPPVIFEAGLGSDGRTWEAVADPLAGETQVCRYDRRGIGLSDPLAPGTGTRTAADIVRDLRRVLQAQEVRPPFILVGHSAGGLSMRLFAAQHPDEVAGLVLVDASHEDQYERKAASLPPAERDEYLRHEDGNNFEGLSQLRSAAEIRRAAPLPPVPLVVLSAPGDADHTALQSQLALLTSGATHHVVADAGHFIHVDRPGAVVEAIGALVRRVRARRVP